MTTWEERMSTRARGRRDAEQERLDAERVAAEDSFYADRAAEDALIERLRVEYAVLSAAELHELAHPQWACACVGGAWIDGKPTRLCGCRLRQEALRRLTGRLEER